MEVVIALTENVARQDLTPRDESQGIRCLRNLQALRS